MGRGKREVGEGVVREWKQRRGGKRGDHPVVRREWGEDGKRGRAGGGEGEAMRFLRAAVVDLGGGMTSLRHDRPSGTTQENESHAKAFTWPVPLHTSIMAACRYFSIFRTILTAT